MSEHALKRVLLVEDEPRYRRQIERLLAESDCEIKGFSGAEEALEEGRRFRPDVLISDWMLCDQISGFELAQLLTEENPALQIILISGYPASSLQGDLEKLQDATFLEKPFGIQELREALHKALHGAHPQRAQGSDQNKA